ncbi:Anti-sigma F factor antagonist [Thermobacillus xylanilyticus]|jgi:stage II sporulation protein AA (anti-sigma F factor antagonist)|uniref:Anti-sigma factor antagonist n=1 Tax=Thermobacillus xylanilyticus TaxID=76633 RepID=A0ABN7SAL4_THEXY|nr:STAS domain-containing protein [Thermobacillus xylanilyticus]REJ20497.1 MAG: anti-sigma factor antagonist [Paenibacillaceae bacterium]CAG5091959.1 Anti-sigma F factor antagonist [Thermobacillus xylanilyticus]
MNSMLELNIVPFDAGLSVTLKGDLDQQAEQKIRSVLDWEDGLGEGRRYLILNLHEVNFINSAGMALLIRIARAGRKKGFHTFVCGASAHYQKLFRMVGLTEYVMLYPDDYAALQRIEALESGV